MSRYLAIYMGAATDAEKFEMSEAESQAFMAAWGEWAERHAGAIVDMGTPLGRTKRVDADGTTDIKNAMVGYIVVEADSHATAARIFADHPHLGLMRGNAVEIMECLELPM